MSKNLNPSQLDPNQIVRKLFDQEKDAQRVTIVGGENINISADMSEVIKEMQNLTKPSQESQIIYVDRPIVVKELEIKEIERPTIIKETIYEVIERPVIVKETIFQTIEKPIIVKEYETIEKPVVILKDKESLPMFVKVCMVIQSIALIGIMVVSIIKH